MPDLLSSFTKPVPGGRLSNLDLVDICDSFPYPGQPTYQAAIEQAVNVRIAGYEGITFGLTPRPIAEKLHQTDPASWKLNWSSPVTLTLTAGPDESARSSAIANTLSLAREQKVFEILNGWRNELYPVYGPNGELVLRYERAGCGLFGFVTYGVYLTAFCRVPRPGGASATDTEIKMWVPRRSPTKQTFPGMLDQSVAGGIPAGEQAWTALIRECMEEASIPENIAQKATMAGAITYFYVSGQNSGGENGLLQPECEFVYDIDLTDHPELALKPNDEEVQGFSLMSISDVKEALARREFKPNCAIIAIDFLTRHGIITIENEKDYIEILSRIHRRLEFPVGSCLQDEH